VVGALPVSENGWWLLARLAVHQHYNRTLARNRQEPLPGLALAHSDLLEVARLTLELAKAKTRYRPTSYEVTHFKRFR
jgi:hypothetical protein